MNPLPSIATLKSRPELGIGRVRLVKEQPQAALFTVLAVPGAPVTDYEVAIAELSGRSYEEGQRVYTDVGGRLRAGRIRLDPDLLIECDILPDYSGVGYASPYQIVTFVGGETYRIPESELFPLSGARFDDPTPLLSEQLTEERWWYHARRSLRDAAIAQREAYAGISGLASAAIDVEQHQFGISRRVLHDPVCRYILADEVGLGKTIEAGIVLRQHILENNSGFDALVVVPAHLLDQWELELRSKFGLGRSINEGALVLAPLSQIADALNVRRTTSETPGMLIVDEAHHLSKLAFSQSASDRSAYARLAKISKAADRVLLLSATPVLRSESGFLAMLHLLDPASHPIDDIAGFRERVQSRQPIAELVRLLAAQIPRIAHPGTCTKIRDLLGHDPVITALVAEFETADRDQWFNIQKQLSRRIQRTHRLYDRVIRTRRSDESIANALPTRDVRAVQFGDSAVLELEQILEDWRISAISSCDEKCQSKAGDLFNEWIVSLLKSPTHLLAAWTERLQALDRGKVAPLFDAEHSLLREVLSKQCDNSIHAVAAAVRGIVQASGSELFVVFLTELDDCVRAARIVGQQAVVIDPARPAPFHQQRVWFVPSHLEEGLNLQGQRATLIHADLPFSHMQIEQRIGRVDRLGGTQTRVPSVVLLNGGAYQSAWFKCLKQCQGVFTQSVSNIQYLLAHAEDILRSELLEHGIEAFSRLREALAADEGKLSITLEERRILEQDLIDASDQGRRASAAEYKRLDRYEYGGGADAFVDAFFNWTLGGLKFKALDVEGDSYTENRRPRKDHPFQFLVRDRHIPKSHIVKYMAQALQRAGKMWKTDWISASRKPNREIAGKRLPMPLRIGHPFVDGVLATLDTDDRGRGFALWVEQPTTLTPGAYFCFEFVRDLQIMNRDATLRRIADAFVPPFVAKIWLTESGDRVSTTEAELLEKLVVTEDANVRSVKDGATWKKVEDLISSEWRSTCYALRQVAEHLVAEDSAWGQRLIEIHADVNIELQELAQQLSDREAASSSVSADTGSLRKQMECLKLIVSELDSIMPRLEGLGAVLVPNE